MIKDEEDLAEINSDCLTVWGTSKNKIIFDA